MEFKEFKIGDYVKLRDIKANEEILRPNENFFKVIKIYKDFRGDLCAKVSPFFPWDKKEITWFVWRLEKVSPNWRI